MIVLLALSSDVERFPRPSGENCKIRSLVSVIKGSSRGRNQGNLKELNLEALLEPCNLLLLGGSFNTSKEAINKSFKIR